MRIGAFENGGIALIDGDMFVDVTDLVGQDAPAWPPTAMLRFIAGYDELRPAIEQALRERPRRPLSGVRLETPIAWPNKVIAYPANYHEHVEEMKTGTGLISPFKANGQGFFLKANSSLSGPADPILLPNITGRQIHHEAEVAIIIGKGGRDIAIEDAMDHVFGYSCLVDVVVRGREERVMRKSYDSFCPVGPYIVTADEIADPRDIAFELSVNGERRQSANTRDLIVDIPAMIHMAATVMTLYPGDIIASGTPKGVGRIDGGDTLHIKIGGVGEMTLDVVADDRGDHEVWNKDDA
ncbi:fumarylacetoacetate hydrolase family protein [Sphingomonas sp.]|uniref:fumarylacetoacetate hydrolase family protein n=1 Tax=Sphingomonas sp. TaxID=28214 RepID=UPI002DD666FF|nr:fumarylacetoacetate hydrolase family protein [Sphingomonas sp.]